jgi:CRISPR-associated protein Cst2
VAFITGSILLDAPASALNNAGTDVGARTDNTTAVKKIRVPGGGEYAYVSAQAMRYWWRTTVAETQADWTVAPVHRGEDIAFTDANPILYSDDDLFGYMRTSASGKNKKQGSKTASSLDENTSITRISPLRVGTFVSLGPSAITSDFGTMTRQQGNPVPYEHEFYRANVLGLISLDLTATGTFFDGERTGFKNLDSYRREDAKKKGAEEVTVRGQKALRLPLEERRRRVSTLLSALAHLNGGAKQTIHYTDLTPAILMLAVTRHGNNPFYRMLTVSRAYTTQFHKEAFIELMQVYEKDFLSPIYIGWAQGFLDNERARLEETVKELNLGDKVTIAHPVKQIEAFVQQLQVEANGAWFD